MNDDPLKNNYKVIIIGAGASGIGAAITLAKQGISHVVLQARDRIGGRTLSHKIDDVYVDIGASWIHAYGQKNVLYPYVKQFQIKQPDLTDRKIDRIIYDGEQIKQITKSIKQASFRKEQMLWVISQQNSQYSKDDKSVYQSAKDYVQNNINKASPMIRRCTNLAINLTQRHQGSSIKQLSAKNFDFKIDEGSVNFLPQGGYGQFYKKIAHHFKINVHGQKIVQSILYNKNKVIAKCKDGSTYNAKKIIVSLPLGVLKQKKVKFQPQLPQEYEKSIQRLGVGLMNKIVLSFDKNFWGPVAWLNIAFDEVGKFSQLYNFSQNNANILCCFLTGDFARKCEKYSNDKLVSQLLQILSRIYGKQHVRLKQYIITNWGQDQFSLGSYTSFHVGSSPLDCHQLKKPIQNILWLVGEHCYANYIGTAHGAFSTGIQAAQNVISQLLKEGPKSKF